VISRLRLTDDNRRWWTLGAMCFALFMVMLDNTVTNVALPSIQREFDASLSSLEWTINAYTLTFAVLLVTGGRLGDIFGRRRIFLVGVGVFAASSAAIGLAPTEGWLVVARAVQGAGAAFMMPGTLSIISNAFPPEERGKAIGTWAGVSAIALALGPLVGGWLTEDVSWRAIFFLNLPVAAGAIAVTLFAAHESRDETVSRAVDIPGIAAITVGLTSLVLALVEGNAWGWGSPEILALFATAVISLFAFIAIERRSPAPIVDFDFFRSRSFVGANVVAFAVSFSMLAMFFFLTLYMQNILGYTPLETGVRFLPVSLLSFLAAPIAGKLAERYPVRVFLTAGLGLIGLGLVEMHGVNPGDDWTTLLPGFILAGIGIGFVNPPLATAAIGVVEPRRSGAASGINSTARQVGTAVGIAGLGAILQSKLSHGLGAGSLGGPAAASAYIDALNDLFLVAAAVAFVGAACAAVLIRRRDFVSAPA
jgi:EmrB/QacA subfamily drug resistance transporter